MQLVGFREANGFSHQAFEPRAQREMFAFQLLRPALADHMELRLQLPLIGTPEFAQLLGAEAFFEYFITLPVIKSSNLLKKDESP